MKKIDGFLRVRLRGGHAPGSHGHGEAPQALALSPADLPGATRPQEVALAEPSLASTPEKRHQLAYLIRCALPADIVVYADVGPERFTFPGRMGLAPGWLAAGTVMSDWHLGQRAFLPAVSSGTRRS